MSQENNKEGIVLEKKTKRINKQRVRQWVVSIVGIGLVLY